MTWEGGGTDAPQVLTVLSGPVIATVDPDTVVQGETVAVSLEGRNLLPGARVVVGGGVRTIRSFVIDGRVEATLDIPEDAAPGPRDVILTNADGGATTAQGGLLVRSAIEPPEVAGVDPNVVVRGQADQDLVLTGQGFQPGALLRIPGPGGFVGPTIFVDAQTLTATLEVTEDAPVGARDVRVENPDGGVGRLAAGLVIDSGLAVERVDPDSLLLGDADTQINIFGQRFGDDSEVDFVGPGGSNDVVATEVAATSW